MLQAINWAKVRGSLSLMTSLSVLDPSEREIGKISKSGTAS